MLTAPNLRRFWGRANAQRGMGTYCLVTGVPSHALLGDLEAVLLPVCMQRILAIEVQEHNALIEFESEVDAEACVGETRLLDSTVQVDRHDSSSITPSRAPYRRTKSESKADRERRLNRVGLSYRCGKCVPARVLHPKGVEPIALPRKPMTHDSPWRDDVRSFHPGQVRPAEEGPRVHRAGRRRLARLGVGLRVRARARARARVRARVRSPSPSPSSDPDLNPKQACWQARPPTPRQAAPS